jgi:flagellum-specific peptidoglycan hydrolase FlgJ
MQYWKPLCILTLAALLAACQPSQATGSATATAAPAETAAAAAATVPAIAAPPQTTVQATAAIAATVAATTEPTAVPTAMPTDTPAPTPTATSAPTATAPPTATQAPAPTAGPTTAPPASHEAYIKQIAPYAQAEQADSGVPAAFSIALAANETGWGVSVLSNKYHNYHGITCSPPNEGLPCVDYNGVSWNQYSSPEAGFVWAGRWLKGHSQFASAFQHTDDVATFTHEVLKCYISCGSPFPQKLYDGTLQMIQQYNLTQYDKPQP